MDEKLVVISIRGNSVVCQEPFSGEGRFLEINKLVAADWHIGDIQAFPGESKALLVTVSQREGELAGKRLVAVMVRDGKALALEPFDGREQSVDVNDLLLWRDEEPSGCYSIDRVIPFPDGSDAFLLVLDLPHS